MTYMTTREVADRWKASHDHVTRLAQQGELPAFKVGTHYRFSLREVELYEKRTTTGLRTL